MSSRIKHNKVYRSGGLTDVGRDGAVTDAGDADLEADAVDCLLFARMALDSKLGCLSMARWPAGDRVQAGSGRVVRAAAAADLQRRHSLSTGTGRT